MLTLFHYPLHAGCRTIRLMLAERGAEFTLIEETPWQRRREFLQLNPDGAVPVMLGEEEQPICGAFVIAEYLEEEAAARGDRTQLMPGGRAERAEIRRLADWYLRKCENEVTRHMVRERVTKPLMPPSAGGGSPDAGALRAARANIGQHMKYLDWLAGSRNWLAGDAFSLADLASGATLSVLDYLGEIEWNDYGAARDWYARMKSRPAFQPLLKERVRGLPPSAHYADPDF